MKGHWNQIGQCATCLAKYKCKCKNQNLLYQQTEHTYWFHQSSNSSSIRSKKSFSISSKSSRDTLFSILDTLHNGVLSMATDNNIHTIVLKSSGSDNIGHTQNNGVVVYWVFPLTTTLTLPSACRQFLLCLQKPPMQEQ